MESVSIIGRFIMAMDAVAQNATLDGFKRPAFTVFRSLDLGLNLAEAFLVFGSKPCLLACSSGLFSLLVKSARNTAK